VQVEAKEVEEEAGGGVGGGGGVAEWWGKKLVLWGLVWRLRMGYVRVDE